MKIDIHKLTAVFAVLVLVGAVIWWVRWQREPAKPIHKQFEDSIDYHINQAQKHADIAHKYFDEVEKYAEVYHVPAIDSAKRARLGAEIWANAVRKADSLRKRTP